MVHKIGFIGAGNMATALIVAFSKAKVASVISVSDRNVEKLEHLRSKVDVFVSQSNVSVVQESSIVFVCVKPKDVVRVMDEIKDHVSGKLVVSIAAGITLETLESTLDTSVVRVMPNTPCLVGEMAAGYALGTKVSKKEAQMISDLLNVAGVAVKVSEKDIDVVSALSGSGPAFMAYLFKIMVKSAEKQGLSSELAWKLMLQTAKGTAIQMQQTGMSADDLITMVSSPGGSTIEGRKVLEKAGLEKVFSSTLEAAVKKNKQLG
ncbi:MAG: pyrroline-5-carboxylate reductase [Nanoarchaeota archaeon]|nr:pyrroline-5-carboxylate reductase [Nanoarchaeota archaeon]